MKIDEKYIWTWHVKDKLRYYRLTESRIKRIIRHPARTEEGVIDGAVACMQPAGGKEYSEIWTFYVLSGKDSNKPKIKIISAWRYPGHSPKRDPIPENILKEIKKII